MLCVFEAPYFVPSFFVLAPPSGTITHALGLAGAPSIYVGVLSNKCGDYGTKLLIPLLK